MIETEDYWIYENKLIFKPEFNKQINNYFDIISNYEELIFTDYNNLKIMLMNNNLYLYDYDKFWTKSISKKCCRN